MTMMNDKILKYQAFMNREKNTVIPNFECEQHFYYQVKAGDRESVARFQRMWEKKKFHAGLDDSLLGAQMAAAAVVTMVSRSVISAGLDETVGYNIDAFYKQKVKDAYTAEEVKTILNDMIEYSIDAIEELKSRVNEVYSSRIAKCTNYIYYHLHDKVSLSTLAEKYDVSPSYLATQFKSETGYTVSEYVTKMKMEAAEGMLRYSELSIVEISDVLAYSSQSHFTKVFREWFHVTPKQYRDDFRTKDDVWEETK